VLGFVSRREVDSLAQTGSGGRSTFLSFSPPAIGEEEIGAVADSLRTGWLTTGPKVRAFEQAFAETLDCPSALAVNSGTAALHLALKVLGIGPGDEVITTTMTFCSSVHVIEHVGARAVLVDVEPDTLNIDPCLVEKALGPRTRAILPVHLHGHPADMEPILDIARRHELAVVEDAAHALPARYRGRPVGRPVDDVPNLVAFSFYATKNVATGEGGMLTGTAPLVDEARTWALHGMSRDAYKRYTAEGSWRYDVVVAGFKYNMADLQAALGLVQLRRLPDLQRRRREIVERYDDAFRRLPAFTIPVRRPDAESALHIYCLRLELERLAIDRDGFIKELNSRKIGSSVHFIPVHHHSYYRGKYGYPQGSFPVADREFERMVSIPLSPGLSDQDVDDVIGAIADIDTQFRL
jgi:dTDP-4-amino-4,6-dideoxygalactose transaminase